MKDNQDNNNITNSITRDNTNNNHKSITIVIPYIKGFGDRFKKICQSKGIQVHFKGTNTLRTLLVKPKDKDNKMKKVETFITSSALTSTAQMLTLESLAGHFGKESENI